MKSYPAKQRKKYLRQLQRSLDEGLSMKASCEAVSKSAKGYPSAWTLRSWAKTEELSGNGAAASNPVHNDAATHEHGNRTDTEQHNQPDTHQRDTPSQAPDDSQPEETETPTSDIQETHPPASEADPMLTGEHAFDPRDLVPVASVDTISRDAVDAHHLAAENQHLHAALEEQQRELTALRRLVACYVDR